MEKFGNYIILKDSMNRQIMNYLFEVKWKISKQYNFGGFYYYYAKNGFFIPNVM